MSRLKLGCVALFGGNNIIWCGIIGSNPLIKMILKEMDHLKFW